MGVLGFRVLGPKRRIGIEVNMALKGTLDPARYRVYIPYRSLMAALNTLNSPPVVSFNKGTLDPSRYRVLPRYGFESTDEGVEVAPGVRGLPKNRSTTIGFRV